MLNNNEINSWRGNPKLKEEYIKVSYLYLSSRNLFNMGWNPYSFFRNLIRYIIKDTDQLLIRYIFQSLLAQQVFIFNKKNKSTEYLFNPHNRYYNKQYKLEFI